MGWFGYGIYDGDETQTLHYYWLLKTKIAKNFDEAFEMVKKTRTIIPKNKINQFKKEMKKIIDKTKPPKSWNEDKALHYQMLLSLYLDNKLKPPAIVKKLGLEATKYLLNDHCDEFDNPSARRKVLKGFIERTKSLI